MKLTELTDELKNIYGENLESVILYGSAADGEFHDGLSDYNTIVVLKNLAAAELAKSAKLIKKWSKKNNPVPLFFTKEIINSSIDVFPIEFFDIKERHKVMFGSDPFEKISIDLKNLRHQCEHELRSKLLSLNQKFTILSDSPKEIIRLILESSSSFFAIFGGVFRLAGKRPVASKKGLAEDICQLVDTNPTTLLEILDVREKTRSWKNEDAVKKFQQYLTSIEAVVRFVDKL